MNENAKTHAKKHILDAMNFRHACKEFDSAKKIPNEDRDFLLETARLSPSSFGMEGTLYTVITDPILREKIKPHAWGQKQIEDASFLVVFSANPNKFEDENFLHNNFVRRGLDEEATNAYIQKFKGFLQSNNTDLACWASKQCYIAMSSMINAAAMIGIDSCPIEGFVKDSCEELLGLENIALMCAFGYRLHEPQRPKTRFPLDEIVRYI